MEDKQGVCVFISAFEHVFFFFCSPHGNIQQKPWDEFCWEVRMSMLIFFPLLRRLSLTQRPWIPPPWSPRSQSKKPFCFQSSLYNQTLRNISTSGCSGAGDPDIWGLYWFPVEGGGRLPSELFRVATLALQPIFCCDCHACVLMAGCSSRLSYTGVTQASTLLHQYYTPFEPGALAASHIKGKLLMWGKEGKHCKHETFESVNA